MPKLSNLVAGTVVLLVVAAAVGPTVIALADALVPAVLYVGLALVAVRLVWFYTSRL